LSKNGVSIILPLTSEKRPRNEYRRSDKKYLSSIISLFRCVNTPK
jgi:hypothetical protein